jgi:hypothetical protein
VSSWLAPVADSRRVASTVASMSTTDAADEWDFTVPADERELLAELRRHGMAPGARLHMSITKAELRATDGRPTPRRFGFTASIHAEADLSEKTDEYLRGFGLG